MTAKKKENYNKEDIRLARFAKALAHPARITIIRQLASKKSCFFNEISEELPLADSTVSQHIAELKSAGLVIGRLELPKIKYQINYGKWKQDRQLFKEFTKIKSSHGEQGQE